jgi:G3E family GTPase
MARAVRIPVTVITGFLGSGKTTLLNHLVQQPELKDAAVLINELGEISIDHLLVRDVDENIVRLASGCLCCGLRGDLINTLRDLYVKRARAAIPRFRRMVIETTGLADPAPVLQTLMNDALIASHFRLDGVVATIDAINGSRQLKTHAEAVKQAAVADRLLITKTDLVAAETVAALLEEIRRLNPTAPLYSVIEGRIAPARLLNAGLYNPASKIPDVARWLNTAHYSHTHAGIQHDASPIRSFCLTFGAPVIWRAFADALQKLIDSHGEHLLRVKGVLNVRSEAHPVVVHGVQHVFHPPARLTGWPDDDRSSKIVFITRGLERDVVESALRAIAPARQRADCAPL